MNSAISQGRDTASTSSVASSTATANHAALAAKNLAVSLALQYVIDTFFTPKERFPPVRVTTRVSGLIVFQGAGHACEAFKDLYLAPIRPTPPIGSGRAIPPCAWPTT